MPALPSATLCLENVVSTNRDGPRRSHDPPLGGCNSPRVVLGGRPGGRLANSNGVAERPARERVLTRDHSILCLFADDRASENWSGK